jgi:hypothetical protein
LPVAQAVESSPLVNYTEAQTISRPAIPFSFSMYDNLAQLPFELRSDLERQIAASPDWRAGMRYGSPRPGHPEGQVQLHVAEVLANIDRFYAGSPLVERLRLLALLHDAFKYQAGGRQVHPHHHGQRARRFAAGFIDDPAVLEVLETHDESYHAWLRGGRYNDWEQARAQAAALIERLGPHLELYLAFLHCDNHTGDKRPDDYHWFRALAREGQFE